LGSSFQAWKIGDVTITKIVEKTDVVDLPNILPKSTVKELLALPWLQPHFLTPEGRAIFSFHALVIETPTKRVIVDTCWGNDKQRGPWEHAGNLQTTFLQTLASAGFPRDSIDVVLCTHLHVDHIGWNTMLVDGKWVPTFPKARYILNKTEYEYWAAPTNVPTTDGWDEVQRLANLDSIKPVSDAGQIDLVEGVHKICDEVTLVPTLGHSPGHVSVRVSSRGEEALITGDMIHHPSQLAHLDWCLDLDFDPALATKTRGQVFAEVADRPVLVIGTHWAGITAGRIRRDGKVFRLVF
jgi:glyoxylase-like metal-dependent hydrolase (beta-lactamase superfamily II)